MHQFYTYILGRRLTQGLIFASALMVLTMLHVDLQAQSNAVTLEEEPEEPLLTIDSISIEGVRKTRKSLILRELELKEGDRIALSDLAKVLERNRLRLLNLSIFSQVALNVRDWQQGDCATLHIKVAESWYIFPSPVFELADRNFNVWWHEFDHSFKRVNVGGDWTQYNFTGHADQLNATFATGYNNRYNLRYRTPTINKKQTLGLEFGVSYSRLHEVATRTFDNKIDFISDPQNFLIGRFTAEGKLTYRPRLLSTHALLLEYRNNWISDTIARLNPDFFLQGQNRQSHAGLVYTYTYDTRDIRPYPMNGWNLLFELRQNGLLPDDNFWAFRARAEVARYHAFNSNWSIETAARARVTLPRSKIPYFNNQALGYGGDLVRGYDYYVVDGLDLYVLKTTLRRKIFQHKFHYPKRVERWKERWFRPVPLKVYASVINDVGYARDPWYADHNPLANRPLYGYGLGLDFLAYYGTLFQIQWVATDIGTHGFFIRTKL